MKRPTLLQLSKKNQAFTFVELLITVSIMVLILVAGMVNYLRYLDKQQLYRFATRVESMVHDTQVKSRTGYLGDEDLGFCNQIESVELEMTRNIDSFLVLTEKLNCVAGASIELDVFTAEDNFASDHLFSIAFLPIGGVEMELDSGAVNDMDFILSSDEGQVSFSFGTGGVLEVTYD